MFSRNWFLVEPSWNLVVVMVTVAVNSERGVFLGPSAEY